MEVWSTEGSKLFSIECFYSIDLLSTVDFPSDGATVGSMSIDCTFKAYATWFYFTCRCCYSSRRAERLADY